METYKLVQDTRSNVARVNANEIKPIVDDTIDSVLGGPLPLIVVV
jgi:hypothetical protein